jgi:hypothetical protein
LYTLYRAAPASGRSGHAFIHTLGLNGVAQVFCLDLPDDLGFATSPGSLVTSRDGTHLYALNATGRLADIAVNREPFGNGTRDPLAITRSVDLGIGTTTSATTNAATAEATVSVTTTKDALWATVGATLVKVDPVTFTVIERSALPSPATAVAVFDDVAMVAGASDVAQRSSAGAWTTVATLPPAVSSPISLQLLD